MDFPTKCHILFVNHLCYTSFENKNIYTYMKTYDKQAYIIGLKFPMQFNQWYVLTSLAIDTKVGSRWRKALNFSSASVCVAARYKLQSIWIYLVIFFLPKLNLKRQMRLPVGRIQIVAAWSIQNDFKLNFAIFNLTKCWPVQYHTFITT